MNGRHWLAAIIAIGLSAAVGLTTGPASAKKKTSETVSIQKEKKRAAANKCKRGPVPPFMRNPRYMNRGFLKNRC
ncbi:MAG: hypothetical protein AAGF09_02825 [Pseudomonadota bacterium]